MPTPALSWGLVSWASTHFAHISQECCDSEKMYCLRKMLCNNHLEISLVLNHILGKGSRNLTLFARLFLVERDGRNTRPSEGLILLLASSCSYKHVKNGGQPPPTHLLKLIFNGYSWETWLLKVMISLTSHGLAFHLTGKVCERGFVGVGISC